MSGNDNGHFGTLSQASVMGSRDFNAYSISAVRWDNTENHKKYKGPSSQLEDPDAINHWLHPKRAAVINVSRLYT